MVYHHEEEDIIETTGQCFARIMDTAYKVYVEKDREYGPVWKVFRPISMNDQIFIKIKRIRTIQETGVQKVADSIDGDMFGIVNYCLMMIMVVSAKSPSYIVADLKIARNMCYDVMVDKNHDYGEAWREFQKETFVDLMLVKSLRIRTMLLSGQNQFGAEGAVIANIIDICNYAVFYLILYQEK